MAVILFRITMLLSLYQKWTAPAINHGPTGNLSSTVSVLT